MPAESRFPTSIVLGGLVVGPMVATVRAPGVHADLLAWFGLSWVRWRDGQIWRLFTSTFVQSRHGIVAGIVSLVWLLPLAEWRIGSRRAAIAFLTGDWLSSLTVMLVARAMAAFGSGAASGVLARLDSGASSACYACGAAFVSSLSPSLLRNVLIAVLVGHLAIAVVVDHRLADIQHPMAAIVGAGFLQLATRHDRRDVVSDV